MPRIVEYSLLYLTTPRNIELLQMVCQSSLPVSFVTLQKKLKKMKSQVQLQKCLRRGEILGFIERKRDHQGNFQCRATLYGKRVLQQYLELLRLLEANEIHVEMRRS